MQQQGEEHRGPGGWALTPPTCHGPACVLSPRLHTAPPTSRAASGVPGSPPGSGCPPARELLPPDEQEAELCLLHAPHLARHLAAAWAGWGPGSDLHAG